MGAVGRIILILIILVLVVGGAGYFLVPPVASRSQTVEVERPASTVLARLASTPSGTVLAEGVTVSGAATAEGDTVTAPVTFADGAEGRVIYTVTQAGEGSSVVVKLEQDLGPSPLERINVITGGDVAPLIEAAASSVSTDLGALPNATFEGLVYVVEQVQPRPFFYVENCSDASAESITSIISQAVAAIPAVMRTNNLQVAGELMAVEPRVVSNQYCYQVGYPYTGRQPRALLIGKTGETPAGTVLRVNYTGTEQDVMAQVYDRFDALLGAAHLDNPATREDDWATYEVYHDDPMQPGGSRNRDVYYVVPAGVDLARVTALAAPVDALPAAAPAATPAEPAPASTTPAETPAATPPATTPAPTP
jgi:hypothetical protein